MKRYIIGLVGVMLSSCIIHAQIPPVADYSMDDCTLNDKTGNLSGQYIGTAACGCGVRGNGLLFSGQADQAVFPRGVNDIVGRDWTMTFYVLPQNNPNEVVDLFFLGDACRRDSVFSVRYFSSSGIFRARLSDGPNNEVEVNGNSDHNTCWQFVALVKSGATLTMFINGQPTEQNAAVSDLNLVIDSDLLFSNSPCQLRPTNPDMPFRGTMDELRFYDRPLIPGDIQLLNLKPDQITTPDTTVFQGASVQIRHGGSCSDDFTWSPTTTLSDPNRLDPIVTPDITTTYTLTINQPGCMIEDNVTIRVVDPAETSCEDLRLPSAFTPNNDRINDFYGISNTFLIEALEKFEIYNRWGGRVFITTQPQDTWDGIYQGQEAAASSYVYLVQYTCDGQSYEKTGTLNLIR